MPHADRADPTGIGYGRDGQRAEFEAKELEGTMEGIDTWYVVRRADGTPHMYVVAYDAADADTYLPLLKSEMSHGSTVELVTDPDLLARLVAASDNVEELDGVWLTDVAHAWRAETGFAHGHN